MSQSRNMRGLIATSHGRMALVLWSGWAVVLGCGLGLAADEAPEGAGPAKETGAPALWTPPVGRRKPPAPAAAAPAASPAPVTNPAPAAPKLVFSKGSPAELSAPPVEPEPVVAATAATVSNKPPAMDDHLRDPFWPIDYVLPVRPALPGEKIDPLKEAKVFEAEWREVEKVLHGTSKNWGRMSGKHGENVYFVMIGGKPFDVGDVVSLAANGKTYRWKVASISLQGGPVFERIISPSGVPSPKK